MSRELGGCGRCARVRPRDREHGTAALWEWLLVESASSPLRAGIDLESPVPSAVRSCLSGARRRVAPRPDLAGDSEGGAAA